MFKKIFKKREPFKFLDKRPLVGTGLIALQIYIILYFIRAILFEGTGFVKNGIASIMGAVKDGYDFGPDVILVSDIVNWLICIALAFLLLLVHKIRLRPNFAGVFRKGENQLGYKISLIFLPYLLITVILNMIFGKFGIPDISVFLAFLSAVIMEEVTCRAIPLSFAMRHRKREKMIPMSIILTSVISSFVCYLNFSKFVDVKLVIVKVFCVFCMSIFFGMVYLRTGNIIFTMVMKFLGYIAISTDLMKVFVNMAFVSEVSVVDYVDIFLCLALAGVGFYFIRSEKNQEDIISVWDRKWNGFIVIS